MFRIAQFRDLGSLELLDNQISEVLLSNKLLLSDTKKDIESAREQFKTMLLKVQTKYCLSDPYSSKERLVTREGCGTNQEFVEIIKQLKNEIAGLRPYLERLQEQKLMAKAAEGLVKKGQAEILGICENERQLARDRGVNGGLGVDEFALADEKLQCQLRLWLEQNASV